MRTPHKLTFNHLIRGFVAVVLGCALSGCLAGAESTQPVAPPAEASSAGTAEVSADPTTEASTAVVVSTVNSGGTFCDVAHDAIKWYMNNQGPQSTNQADVESYFRTSAEWFADLDSFNQESLGDEIAVYRAGLNDIVAALEATTWSIANIPTTSALDGLRTLLENGFVVECGSPSTTPDDGDLDTAGCLDTYMAFINLTEGSAALLAVDLSWQQQLVEQAQASVVGVPADQSTCDLVAYLHQTYGNPQA